MGGKKYLWMDGTTRDKPDPNWDQKKAEELGLIKKAGPSNILRSQGRDVPVYQAEAILNSMGSIRWDQSGSGENSR